MVSVISGRPFLTDGCSSFFNTFGLNKLFDAVKRGRDIMNDSYSEWSYVEAITDFGLGIEQKTVEKRCDADFTWPWLSILDKFIDEGRTSIPPLHFLITTVPTLIPDDVTRATWQRPYVRLLINGSVAESIQVRRFNIDTLWKRSVSEERKGKDVLTNLVVRQSGNKWGDRILKTKVLDRQKEDEGRQNILEV